DVDGLAHRLEPAGDGALGDGLAQCGHGHVLALGATAGRPGRGRGLGFSRLVLPAGGSLLVGGAVLTAGGSRPPGLLGAGSRVAVFVEAAAVDDDASTVARLGVDVPIDQDDHDRARDECGTIVVDIVARHVALPLVDVDGLAHRLEPAGDG